MEGRQLRHQTRRPSLAKLLPVRPLRSGTTVIDIPCGFLVPTYRSRSHRPRRLTTEMDPSIYNTRIELGSVEPPLYNDDRNSASKLTIHHEDSTSITPRTGTCEGIQGRYSPIILADSTFKAGFWLQRDGMHDTL